MRRSTQRSGGCHDAFEGAKREPENKLDSEEYRVKRELERRRKEKALAEERAAERAAIEKDVEEKAQKKLELQVSSLEKEKQELATKREEAQQQLKKAAQLRSAAAAKDRATAAQLAQIAEIELQAAMAVSLKQATEGQKASGGALACALEDSERECVVCLSEPKCICSSRASTFASASSASRRSWQCSASPSQRAPYTAHQSTRASSCFFDRRLRPHRARAASGGRCGHLIHMLKLQPTTSYHDGRKLWRPHATHT